MKRAWICGLVLGVLVGFSTAAWAQDDALSSNIDINYIEDQLLEPETSYPFLEHHGYFRFRADNFWNLDLDTAGTSPILPPLEATRLVEESIPADRGEFYDEEAELISGANIRFRYHPIIHITDGMRIHSEFDILNNLVLGSTPDGFSASGRDASPRFDVPLVGFTPGQRPPNEEFTTSDAITVRQVYAEMEFLGLIRVGRMASNWGLGLLANGGGSYSSIPLDPRTSRRTVAMENFDCIDCDFGDLADRLMFTTRLFPTIYIGGAYDWSSSGTVAYSDDQPFGQARDLAQLDDVSQFVVTAFRRHMTDQELRERDRDLKELRLPVVEGGAYVVFRDQSAEQGQGGFLPNDTTSDFYPRSASAIIPDLWVRMLWEPAFRQRIRLELEVAGIFGEVENALPGLPDTDNPSAASRDIQQFGAAFESDFRFDNFTTGFNAGYASGRSTEGDNARLVPGWGVLDLNPVTGGSESDHDITNFKFDRDYFVDMIMFRELIGTITNTIYFDPYVQYNFFTAQNNALGFRFDAIYAMAANADVTPGGESSIGLELDLMLYYVAENYQATASYGLLFPFEAFDGVVDRARIPAVRDFWNLENTYEADIDASLAHTLQFHLMWAF